MGRPRSTRSRERGAAVLALALCCTAAAVRAETLACDPSAPLGARDAVIARTAACESDGRPAEGVTIARAWLATHPDDVAMRQTLARLLVAQNDLAGAQAEYDLLLRAAPDDPALRKARADVLAWRGQLDEAIAEYRALLAASPDDPAVELGLGLALRWQGHLDEADRLIGAAAAAGGPQSEAAHELATLHDSPAWRVREAERAREATPDDPELWIASADALSQAESWADAGARLDEAAQRFPQDARIPTLRAEVKTREEKVLSEREATARATLAEHPDDAEARLALASILAARQDLAGATAEYERHLAAHPDDLAARRELARVTSWAGNYGRSIALYDGLVAASPDDAALRLERARVLSWDGQLSESAAECAQLADVAPGPAARGLADAYRWGGWSGAAARHYRSAVLLGASGEDAHAEEEFLALEHRAVSVGPTFTLLEDSDHFIQRRYLADASLRLDPSRQLTAAFTHADYAQHGGRLMAERPRIGVVQDLGEWARLGLAYGPNIYDDGQVTQSGAASVTGIVGPETAVSLAYDHYDLIDEVLTLRSAVPDVLQGNRVRVGVQHVLPWRLEAAASSSWAWYSDGNSLTGLAASLGRRVLRNPDLRVGWEVSYLSYAQRSTLYWDPPDYVSNGAVVRVAQPIVRLLRVVVDGRLGYGIERGTGALERAVGIRFEAGPVRGVTGELGFRHGDSVRSGQANGSDGYVVNTGWVAVRWGFNLP